MALSPASTAVPFARELCPVCQGGARVQPVYKHRWLLCEDCGNASRVPRARVWSEYLPDSLVRRAPASVVRRATPQGFFRALQRDDRETMAVTDLLQRYCLDDALAILDIGGGPGFVAAALAAEGRRVVLAEHEPRALAHAASLGVESVAFDFAGPPLAGQLLPRLPDGFSLILCRYALAWCADLARFAADISDLAAHKSSLLLSFVTPSLGAMLTSATEDQAPLRLWNPDHVARTFEAHGWQTRDRFEALPPLPCWRLLGPARGLLSLPWAAVGPATDLYQHHAGLLLTRTDVQPVRSAP